jgi:NADH-quinone oxidoreductase subunit J
MAETIIFWLMAALAVAAALMVVLGRNIFRAALALVVCFLAVAGLFIVLAADFLAAAQVLIYVGAVAVLIIMAIMLTREVERGNSAGRSGLTGPVTAVVFTGVGIWPFSLPTGRYSSPPRRIPTNGALATSSSARTGCWWWKSPPCSSSHHHRAVSIPM